MINRLLKLILVTILIFLASCSGKVGNRKWIETLPKPWLLSEKEVSDILPDFHKRYPNFEDRLRATTIWRIGTPYKIFQLGEETLPDTDPIIRLDVSDCTVHVLTSLSFAQSKTWEEARDKIIKIHYKTDVGRYHIPTYKSRWHFTSDRILSNPSTVNITTDFADLETTEIKLNQKSDGTELLDLDWSKEIQLSFIPNTKIDIELLKKLPQICGVAFVRKSLFKNGLAIAHEGILIDQQDLIHASSVANKTVRVKLIDYYFNNGEPSFDGIMIYKFVPLD